MIWDIGLGLGCYHLLKLGFVLDYEIFLGTHPAILDTLDANYFINKYWKDTYRYLLTQKIVTNHLYIHFNTKS